MDASKYAHSPTHNAIVTKDHVALEKIILNLPQLCSPAEILTESVSLAEESKADAISAVIDGRDVPNRDTPLHLAVKLGDEMAAEMLMLAGADWSLQNEQGWSALQEAICKREEKIAKIIVKQYQPIAWAKWCRRLPRVVGVMRRMRDFYMEITFQFESSVIPFISKIAPSDTYKIWKRGANLRADMTLAGFDGFRIQRMDQSILFLGDGSEDGKVPSGSLCIVIHKDKEVMNALEGAGAPASDSEVRHEVAAMMRTNIFRPGIDVTEAVLLPQTTWRRHERTETVGPWKTKVYDMHNVVISLKSRKVPGAMTDDELFASCSEHPATVGPENEAIRNILTDDERQQLEAALKMDPSDLCNDENAVLGHRRSCSEHFSGEVGKNGESKHKKKGWLNGLKKKEGKHRPRNSFGGDEELVGDHHNIIGDSSSSTSVGNTGRHARTFSTASGKMRKEVNRENEYKKGLRPTLWLSPNFPLQTEELLPLLDILASKVKAIRRLRELLTTKLPMGTFPVKVAIPVVPTIRVLVTFTKFEELQPLEEFLTPPSSPTSSAGDGDSPPMFSPPSSSAASSSSSSGLFEWIRSPHQNNNHNHHHRRRPSIGGSGSIPIEFIQDPFTIPPDYKWVTLEEKKKKRIQEKKAKKAKMQNQSK